MQSDKKKNNQNDVGNFLKENVILIAVYSLVGILVVVAAALTFYVPSSPKDELIVSIEDTKNVSNNLAKSYKTQVGEAGITNELDTVKKDEPVKEGTKEINGGVEQKVEPKNSPAPTTEPSNTTKSNEVSSNQSSNLIIYEDSQTLLEAQPSLIFNDDVVRNSNNVTYDFNESDDDFANSFSDGQKMIWPTKGEVVFGYSNDTLVYDVTLDQYRTSDSINIKAEVGQDVFAAFDGVVKIVSKSMDQGNYVVIDHGNGWVTTYSQLDDSMKVAVGDNIRKGQQIGTTALPTTKSVALGTHLDFKVTKNDTTINPLSVLE